MAKTGKTEITEVEVPSVHDAIESVHEPKSLAREMGRRQKCLDTIAIHARDAVQTLVDIMNYGSETNRLKAAFRILEYSAGKPSEYKPEEVKPEPVVPDADLETIIDTGDVEELQSAIERTYNVKG